MDGNMDINTVFAALCGGILVKLFDLLFISKKDKNDALIMLVKQLQENVNSNNIKVPRRCCGA